MSHFLSCHTGLSSNGGVTSLSNYVGFCKKCRIPLPRFSGIFCANFSSTRDVFLPCRGMWCAECYAQSGATCFPIKKTYDEEGEEIKRDDEDSRFRHARDGDHYMVPFQCELCHFRNIQRREPIASQEQDVLLLDFIRRANLDAFWARESGTVSANLSSVKRIHKSKDKFGMQDLFPLMGPFPLEDTFGMGAAVAVLDRSLDKGQYEECVQWATFRKVRSTMTNLWQASVDGLKDQVGAYEKQKTWISSSPTHQFFFSRFMTGVHKRVGEMVKRDEPITIELMKAIDSYLDSEWNKAMAEPRATRDYSKLRSIAMMGLWFIGGYCGGLRGEEMVLLELEGTAASLKNLKKPPPGLPPHFDLVVSGLTKGNRLSGAKFKIPCVALTQGSGLRPGRWALRHVLMERISKRKNGRLFTMARPNGKLFEFDDQFYGVLEAIQALHPELISPETDVRGDYGIMRSLRRGVTAHAINMGVDPTVINAVNRWRVERAADVPALDMPNVYARLDQLKPTILRYSAAL